MIIDVKVPMLSESVSEGTLLEWKKKVGEAVARDEILIDIETDKVVLEVPSPQAGVLVEIIAQNGETVAAEQVLARIDTAATASTSAEAPAAAPAPEAAPAAAQTNAAMPAAAKLAAETGVDVNALQGSGRDGRVLKEDVQNAAAKPAAAPAAAPAPVPAGARPEQRVPMSRLRARVAERLLASQQENAILTTFNEVNMKPIMDLRAKYKEKFEKEHGTKLGFMSFFVKAAVAALKKYPVVNASVDGNDIVYHGYFDIGIAIGSPRGLVVPILRDADQMSIADIEQAIVDYAKKAKDGKIALEDLTGGTFSITNGGTFGSMMSTPIINPPQSAILGMHATKERAVVENGQVVVRPMMYLALSYDHRIIDGREAVLTLVAIKDALEDPARLLLDL
ncbi:dihydrolipoyllysine-residue succinyltransferase, E2 component of oxoglutarate dehydrogenase (succinyl-transferring) complex [Neisseria sicca ATCC 29256]|jgi:dihydrolipoyllysine-residue succinyltransferase, E2 component of oxoglutarate dehydrogenase (succinyl-transferring) complex|uniref:Dihydrolipoyllysine-residue succinyltransferase component of 2-oxoglutarate dehydrogenase complex n=1 Tax=Neisseria sicca ATCC 29256 TaxID=547045 RepID=C6M1A5_NEISI|nr:2-oxoglutarate dehydrogenase complex dihydrolipoyllysine-residue succinyltransferase [Neisseria sicca]EET46179.1 dihydrolipoyllysine-residue succinyltransferase, E2 component of oxoglutarate dehydrogenase (succinyl-transferring) complex [Neisseria sicca ATCC 29256]MBF1285167.1 2-oxoglutarate dehydrogenase complex dihydrolipoyllysine-residue succinyltransferase [Neisseria sp.]MBF1293207.1 2-oxoglutarate dehydrogenase complex dihydrolipoyllysine-residue succinyltransferase [Neisseria sp.]QMT38